MSAQHTPGPWSVDDECRVCAGNQVVATVHPRQRDANTWDWDRAERDACLIAAAPDLLAALEAIRDHTFVDAEGPELRAQNENNYRRAIEAIAKAIGSAA